MVARGESPAFIATSTMATTATIKQSARIQIGAQWARVNKPIPAFVVSERYGIYKVRLSNGSIASVDYKDIELA